MHKLTFPGYTPTPQLGLGISDDGMVTASVPSNMNTKTSARQGNKLSEGLESAAPSDLCWLSARYIAAMARSNVTGA